MGSKSFHHSYEMDPEKRRKQILGSWIWNMNLSWIEKTFYKRDCVCMIPSSREPHRCIPGCQICHQLVRCCCGRLIKEHSFYRSNAGGNPSGDLPGTGSEVWTAENHTVKSSTDAYGTIDFQGGSQTSKAKYVRLSSDSKVEDVLHLMVKEWRMQLPKLVISVHGGKQRFDLHPHIKEALSRGLVKVATTTGSWIFTGGVDNGVAEHIGDALKENSSYLNQKVCTVGIAPWGVVEGRQDLVGRNIVVPYQALLTPLSKLHVLNSLHSHFILVDDGTVGRHGAEVPLRKNLESSICLQQIHSRTGKRIPIVALILEGGPGTILTVFEYLQQSPPVPVVVCEGSGRAADLLAYVYKHTENQGNLLEGSEADVIATIKNSFNLSQGETAHMFQTLLACMKTKYLITVYRAGPEEQQDIDVAILTSLLKSTNVSPYDQLVLALAWDREDIAKDFIFVQGRQWLTKPLEQIMLDALVMNRVAFVKLLIEKGVSMHRFLTIPRLEELYNAAQYTSKDTLLQLIQDVKKGNLPATYKITLLDVGLVIEYLMGGTYRCNYTKRNFRTMYKKLNQSLGQSDQGSSSKSDDSLGRIDRKEKTRHGHFLQTAKPFGSKNDTSEKEKVPRSGIVYREDDIGKPFHYPYNELLVWAVLMKRQKMALFFWQHGEESMAKALVARCLFRAMSREAKKWDIIDDTPDKLKEYSKEFGDLAVELLDKAYQSNEIKTMKILTYELRNWSKSTCLKLAVSGKLQTFVSHECTQKLLTEIWMGRLSLRKNSWLKVILGIFLPPVIPFFNYKTKAQMSHIPLSEGAHQMIQSERDDIKYTEEGITLGACKERAFHDGSGENHAETRIEGKYKRLPLAQKYFAFYHAPIVKFWFNTLVYLAFLMLYTYVVLVKMESLPSVQEWIVIITIVTTGVETMREIFVSEAGKISQKLKTHFSSYLNINEFLGILTFLIGFGLRFGSRNIPDSTSDVDFVFESGRIIYCLNTIFWFVRLLDLLNVNQDAGLYVFIMAKMVSKMFFIVVIMGIVVIAFGVPKQGILHPHEEPSIALAQAVVFRPYWMMYGEMFAYEIDPCSNDSVVPHLCVTGSWLNGYLQAVYVFVQYIIMVNLLIAIFNNVYAECKAMSNHLWKFQRYFVIMFYQGKPVLPPPFVLFSHITTVITWLCRGRPKTKSQGPKLFLTEEDQIRLHEFEGQCVQIYFNDKKDHESSKSDERIRVTTERVEDMLGDVKDVRDHVGFIKQLLHHLDDHIGHLQDLSGLTLDSMKTLTAQKALEMNRSHSIMSSDISRSQQTTDDGLGHSVMWRKSRSDQVWSRSLSHPALDTIIHPKASISLRRINSSDTSPTHSSLFLSSDDHNHDEKFDDLEFQKRAFSEHKVGYSQPKSLKIHNSSVAMIHSPQTLPKLRVTPKLKDSLQSQNVQLHTFSVFTDSACSVDQGNTLKEGVVNLAFIDDRGNAIHKHDVDHVGSDFKISDEESTKKDGQLSSEMSPAGGSDCPHDNIHESTVKPPSKSEQLSNSSTITEMFQKLWTKSKHSGFKLYKTKQLSEDTESTYSNEDGLRRTSSCTDLNGFQPTSPSTSNSQFNMDSKSMSYEDLYQIDSKAALLKEPYYSRYSSAPKSSLQKKTFTRFGHDFKTSMEKSFYYSAIERNNLYRLSQSIPFTPLPPVGELATVYRLEESSPNILNNSMSSWSHNGYYSTIEILTKEEMGGGLRRAVKVACTWSENDILKAGHLYIIKSFLPEVVNNWSGVYKDGTVLQLCLREIQQQRAAQKLLFAFNQMKPKAIPYTPKFLEVFLLYCHSVGQWFTIEECMAGRFRKYNNNTGNETVPSNKLEKTMLAFSHWTYEYSRGEFLVLDLQGVGENLTDPSVIKAGERRSNDMVFGPANLGDDAIKYFCANHQCNSCCKHLKLPEIKRNDYVVDEALLRGSALLVSESHGTERPIQQPLREDQQC